MRGLCQLYPYTLESVPQEGDLATTNSLKRCSFTLQVNLTGVFLLAKDDALQQIASHVGTRKQFVHTKRKQLQRKLRQRE